jgi:hypothetical protein
VTIADNTTGSSITGFGLTNDTYDPTIASSTLLSALVDTVAADDLDDFISQSISGGAITVYAQSGAPANVQMRWAKVNSTVNGGADRWNLFIMTNAEATGPQTAWTRVGDDFTFGANGAPTPLVESTDLTNLTVNGVLIGDVTLQHGATGLTQFADPNGTAEVTSLNQNGYAARVGANVGRHSDPRGALVATIAPLSRAAQDGVVRRGGRASRVTQGTILAAHHAKTETGIQLVTLQCRYATFRSAHANRGFSHAPVPSRCSRD